MKKYILVFITMILSIAFADSAIDGLTLALNPNGETLVVAGDSRTIYTLNTETLEVIERTYFGSTINKMAYSADGTVLFVQDSEPDIYILDAETFETKSKLAGYGMMQISHETKRLVALDLDYGGDTLGIFDISENKLNSIAEVSFDKDDDISSMGINADGSMVALFFDSFTSETEDKVSWSDIPDEYKGFEKDIYNKQHDGKEARFVLLSIPDLEVVADYISFYTPYNKEFVFFQGDDVLITNSSNENARYKVNGDVEMWEWDGVGSSYAEAVSADHSTLVVGGYAKGTIYSMENASGFSFELDDVPGATEYFSGFAVAADGTVYGTTTGYRIARIKLAGAGISKTIKPVY